MRAIFKLRPTHPPATISQANGLIKAKTSTVGAIRRKMAAASCHFAPRNTRMMSSENKAHPMVIGMTKERNRL